MGKLRKRNGNYQVRVQVNGVQFAETVGSDRKKAQAVQKELESLAADARLSDVAFSKLKTLKDREKVITFQEAAAAFLEERKHLKHSSSLQWNSILTGHLIPEFGQMALREITPARLRQYQSKLATDVVRGGMTRSARRVNTILQPLRTIFATAVADGIIESDPCVRLKRLSEPPTDVDPLDEAELQLALAAVDEHYRPFFITAAFTGARPSELQAITWADIDWRKEVFQVNKARVRGVEGKPKTPAGNRTVPMSQPVIVALGELQGRKLRHPKYVFTTHKGEPITKHMDRVWARALRKAGIRHRASYQLRHTFASLSLLAGLPPGYIAKVMGHGKDLQTFFRHYARWVETETNAAEAKLKAAFSKTPQNLSAKSERLDKNWTNEGKGLSLVPESLTNIASS